MLDISSTFEREAKPKLLSLSKNAEQDFKEASH